MSRFDLAQYNRNKDKELWEKRMEMLSEMWDNDEFTTEEMNLMCVLRDRLASLFKVSSQHAYKILRRFERYKDVHLSRMPPDITIAHETRSRLHDRSYTTFGKMYVEHFGINALDDRNKYWSEKRYYDRYGECSWNDERCIIDKNGRKHHLGNMAFEIYKNTGVCRANEPDLFDAILQHVSKYGDYNFQRNTKWFSKLKIEQKDVLGTCKAEEK